MGERKGSNKRGSKREMEGGIDAKRERKKSKWLFFLFLLTIAINISNCSNKKKMLIWYKKR